MATLSLSEVRKDYGNFTAIPKIDLEIEDGELLVLVGPSGCGKSTLLRMIAGLEPVTDGDVFLDGDVVTYAAPRDRDVAMVFQDYALYPHMTIEDNIGFGLKMRGASRADIDTRVGEIARVLGIEHLLHRRPAQLSGGQRQRVALGRAMARSPKVFLFDEPLSNLDAKLRGEMRTEIKRFQRSLATTSIYVTHDQIEAMTLADRIVIMDHGVVQQTGTPDDLYNRPANTFVAAFFGSPPMNLITGQAASNGGTKVVQLGEISIQLADDIAPALEAGQELVAGIRPEDVTILDRAAGDLATFETRVELVEPQGSDSVFVFTLGGSEMLGRVDASMTPDEKARITIGIDACKLHLFDAETGFRIEAGALALTS